MVRTSSAMRVQELSKDSRVACTLRDTLKDSPLDRAVHVSLGPAAVCHHTESKKMQDHLDRSSQDQMDLKVARKIDDIRRAFQVLMNHCPCLASLCPRRAADDVQGALYIIGSPPELRRPLHSPPFTRLPMHALPCCIFSRLMIS